MWNLKYDTHGLLYKTETHTHIENRLAAGKRVVGEGLSGSLGLAEANCYI